MYIISRAGQWVVSFSFASQLPLWCNCTLKPARYVPVPLFDLTVLAIFLCLRASCVPLDACAALDEVHCMTERSTSGSWCWGAINMAVFFFVFFLTENKDAHLLWHGVFPVIFFLFFCVWSDGSKLTGAVSHFLSYDVKSLETTSNCGYGIKLGYYQLIDQIIVFLLLVRRATTVHPNRGGRCRRGTRPQATPPSDNR